MDAAFGFCKSDPNVPISHLDYKYIENCSDSKELEKLLKILRSGDEGTYPDLIKFTENRLASINPKSKMLLKSNPLKSVKEIDTNEGNDLIDDLKSWSKQISEVDSSIKKNPGTFKADLPPVRAATELKKESENDQTKQKEKKAKRVTQRSYGEWEIIDVDKEVEKVDKEGEPAEKQETEKLIPEEVISHDDAPEEERQNRANSEKEKGNEAFKAGDFREAIVYYNRSLSIKPVPAVYNNRAMTYIKLDKYEEAIKDCDAVLKQETDNIKALLRRGIAKKSLNQFENAREDFKSVLLLAPDNKRAKELLADISKSVTKNLKDDPIETSTANLNNASDNSSKPQQGKRLLIEEVENSEKSDKIPGIENNNKDKTQGSCVVKEKYDAKSNGEIKSNTSELKQGKRIVIEEIDNSEKLDKIPRTANDDKEEVRSNVEVKSNGEVRMNRENFEPVVEPVVSEVTISFSREGNTHYKGGRYPEAIECYTKALDSISDAKSHSKFVAVAFSNRAACKLKNGDCRGCIHDATESLKLAPTVKAFLRRAEANDTIERYRNAYVDYQVALRLDSSLTSAWSASTRLVKLLKDQEGRDWREKLPKAENFEVSRKAQANPAESTECEFKPDGQTQVGQISGEVTENGKREIQSGAESRDSAFKRTKEDGNKLFKEGKYSDAAECYSKCIKIKPSEVVSYTNRAQCYLKLSKHNQADADCTKALVIEPENIKALYRRAMARKNGVRYEEAKQDLEKILEIKPENNAAKKELEIITSLEAEFAATEKRRLKQGRNSKRVKIEELSSKPNENTKEKKHGKVTEEKEKVKKQTDQPENNAVNAKNKRKGKKLNITEVEEYEDVYEKNNEKTHEIGKDVEQEETEMPESRVKIGEKREPQNSDTSKIYGNHPHPPSEASSTLSNEKVEVSIDMKARSSLSDEMSEQPVNHDSTTIDSKQSERMVVEEVDDSEKLDEIPRTADDGKEEVKSNGETNGEVGKNRKKFDIVNVEELQSLLSKQCGGDGVSLANLQPHMFMQEKKMRHANRTSGESSKEHLYDSKKFNFSSHIEKKVPDILMASVATPVQPVSDEVLTSFSSEGDDHYKGGRYPEAMECYTKAVYSISDKVTHSSSMAVLLSKRAACKFKIGDCSGCIDDATESLNLETSTKALISRASAFESLEKYRQSYVDYKQVMSIDSDNKLALDALGRLSKVLQDLDGSKWREKLPKSELFSKTIQKNDNLPEPKQENQIKKETEMKHAAPEHLSEDKSEILKKTDSNSKAKKKVKKEMQKSSESREQKFQRIKDTGNQFVKQEKYQDAINCYSQCIDLFPEEVVSYTNRALCYLKLDKFKKTITDCTKALAIQPKNIKALFRRALAKKACKEYQEALQDLKALLKIDKSNHDASKELDEIKDLWLKELTKKPQTKTADKTKESSEAKQRSAKPAKPDETSSSRESASSSPKKTSHSSKKSAKDSSQKVQMKKATGFEFLQAWNELKGKPLEDHAELLTQIEATQLPKVISNKIDGEMILTIVSCVKEFFFTKDKLLLGFNVLRYTSKAERFNMALTFLSTKDLSIIKKVVQELDSNIRDASLGITAKELTDLKKAYKVT